MTMTPVDRAQLQAAPAEAVGGATAAPKSTPTVRCWVPGLLTACTAIALAVRGPPPPGLYKNAYFLALSAAFFAGVAGVMAAVVWVSDDPRGRRAAAASRLVVCSSVAALVVAVGLSVASLLW